MAGFGLRLARSQGMEGFSGNLNEFDVSPSNTNAIFTGDPVILNAGYLTAATSTSAAILGVFMGCQYVDSNGDVVFRNQWDGGAGRTNIRASVAMPPSSMFWVRGNAGVNFQQATSVGAAHPFVIAAGNTKYGDSRWSLGAPGAGPVRVHRLVDLPGNAWGTGGPILEVSVTLQTVTFSSAA